MSKYHDPGRVVVITCHVLACPLLVFMKTLNTSKSYDVYLTLGKRDHVNSRIFCGLELLQKVMFVIAGIQALKYTSA